MFQVNYYINYEGEGHADRWLKWFVDLMLQRGEEGCYWLTELHIDSVDRVEDVSKLTKTLSKLRGCFRICLLFHAILQGSFRHYLHQLPVRSPLSRGGKWAQNGEKVD